MKVPIDDFNEERYRSDVNLFILQFAIKYKRMRLGLYPLNAQAGYVDDDIIKGLVTIRHSIVAKLISGRIKKLR